MDESAVFNNYRRIECRPQVNGSLIQLADDAFTGGKPQRRSKVPVEPNGATHLREGFLITVR